ncbi:nucleoside triphosphate pyrophosphohydrolase [Metabacillus litoralis]|uniref:nucleoside triphosphate pyrophosphohydrolase n=1 Tax=Metabacillus litoralis TaxID=152268 RepID=UPI000EF5A3A1|nr:nucleoside triphosphate pyrophosphohydrolase [Metabacillus litoralis]
MQIYNKLVRDKIPQMIQASGKECRTKLLSDTDYINELKIKLTEEIAEYQEALTDGQAIEELADVLEVIRSLAQVHGAVFEEVEAIRQQKADERGGFKGRIFLLDVDE